MGVSGMCIDRCREENADPQSQLSIGVYPFMFGSAKDFDPVFHKLVQVRLCRTVEGYLKLTLM